MFSFGVIMFGNVRVDVRLLLYCIGSCFIFLDSLLQSIMYCYKGVVFYELIELNDWISFGIVKLFILLDRSF